MKLISDLFSTDYGLLSAAVIAFTLGMAVFYIRYFMRKVAEDSAKAGG